jgi:eukaryotic-like serine/threonine-protein kinase
MQLGAYRVLRQIGAGGMGAVYVAEHSVLGRRAAIKVIHAGLSNRPDIIARFFNEARAATAIDDPGIVQVFDYGQSQDGAYIVMELLDGETLEQRLTRQGSLTPAAAVRITRQVASTLAAAHSRGIIHRDLKPENIFIVRDPEVPGGERAKVLDFGIAKLAGEGVNIKTQTSAVMGTPTFMSPEQCRGAGQVDQRSDIYSLGCVLFALVVGRPPFDAEGAGEIIAMHLREPAPAPSQLRPTLPFALDALVLRCLAKDPAARFTNARELVMALDAILPQLSNEAPTPVPPISIVTPTTLSSAASSVVPSPSRSRALAITGIVAALATVIGATIIATTRHRTADHAAAAEIEAAAAPSDAAISSPPQIDARVVAAAPVDAGEAVIPIDAPAPPVVVHHVDAGVSTRTRDAGATSTMAIDAKHAEDRTCTVATFEALIQSATTADAVQSVLARLKRCQASLPSGAYNDLQQQLVTKL